ncbi:MAG: methylenetetrahydrofolate reductase [Chloroflexi bacterium]|nr:methylenetetrahydrofolate reductase [Chloroflexota bacterium]
MSRFADKIESGKFLVTAELEPPKGVDLTKALATADILKDVTDAVNVTDQQASVMRAAPWAICRVLLDRGLEPIMQMTARDRNRIALQSDLLAASILGIENVLCLTGDPTGTGDHPDAKAVFDLNVVAMVEAARSLQDGRDIAGHELQGAPRFCVGAVANPGARPLEPELVKLEQKVEAGARFIQTQAVYDLDEFADFIEQTKHLNVAVLAGIILLKSANQARFMNEKIPGIRVPDSLIDEIDGSQDRPATSVEIAARTIRGLQGLCSGVHIMAMGWERHIPAVLRTAGMLAE